MVPITEYRHDIAQHQLGLRGVAARRGDSSFQRSG